MEILRTKDQIYNKLVELFGLTNEFYEQCLFIDQPIDSNTSIQLKIQISNKEFNQNQINDFTSLVFQMIDFTTTIGNVVKVLLGAKKYEAVFYIVNKIFVAHVGNSPYKSKCQLMFNERNFDRFIELVNCCNISKEEYIPFLVEVYKSEQSKPYFVWKRPAMEYLKEFWDGNEKWFSQFLIQNPGFRYKSLGAILEFNTAKGVEYLIKDFIHHQDTNVEQNIQLAKIFKTEVINYINSQMPKADELTQKKFVEILFHLKSDNDAYSRLLEIQKTTKNPEIRNYITNKIFDNDNFFFKTEEDFKNASKSKVEKTNERIYNIPFAKFELKYRSGNTPSYTDYTFLIQLFKDEKEFENISKLRCLENIFIPAGLEEMAQKLYDYAKNLEDILEVKWLWRFVTLFANGELTQKIIGLMFELFEKQRKKEANYLKNLLIANKKIEKDEILYIDLPTELNQEELEKHTKILHNQFLGGYFYSPANFERIFVKNPIYNKIAQNLVFGEYKFDRLINAFHLIDQNKSFIVGESVITEENGNENIKIGIIHPFDCDFKFDKIYRFFQNPPFIQFKRPLFNSNDYSPTTKCINRFAGSVVNWEPFWQILSENNFKPNKAEDGVIFQSIYHIFPINDVLCEIEFEKPINPNTTYATITSVCFYPLSKTKSENGKYLTQKTDAISINYLTNRYFDYIASIIFDSIKNH